LHERLPNFRGLCSPPTCFTMCCEGSFTACPNCETLCETETNEAPVRDTDGCIATACCCSFCSILKCQHLVLGYRQEVACCCFKLGICCNYEDLGDCVYNPCETACCFNEETCWNADACCQVNACCYQATCILAPWKSPEGMVIFDGHTECCCIHTAMSWCPNPVGRKVPACMVSCCFYTCPTDGNSAGWCTEVTGNVKHTANYKSGATPVDKMER
jgi:hypothetical protein